MADQVHFIVKRDGKKVDFDHIKIREAIRKAFSSVDIEVVDVLEKLTSEVVVVVNLQYSDRFPPSVENVQDVVERIIIRNNYASVAKSYILYREKHKQKRERETLSKIKERQLKIRKADGEESVFQERLLRLHIGNLSKGLEKIEVDRLVEGVCKAAYNDITTSEIDKLILNEARTHIERHPDYSLLSARILLDKMYGDILGVHLYTPALDEIYRKRFSAYLEEGIESKLIHSDLRDRFDLEKIRSAFDFRRDLHFYYMGLQTVEDRYLLRTRKEKKIFELPAWMWMRVAMGIALREEKKAEWAIEFYNVLSDFLFTSSTPTLFNSGTLHSQMSSCYLNKVEDSLEGIFKNYSDNAQLSKWAGGIGTDWTGVRATGSSIKGTNGSSSGIIPFLKIFNDVAIAVNQGGKRKGAMAAYLENWHIDMEEFIELKKNTGDERRRTHDIHPALFISDLFMKRVSNNGDWTLFSPDQVPELHDAYGKKFEDLYIHYENMHLPGVRKVKAKELWKKMLTMLYETGHPWITFKCASNIRNPQDHVGVIHCSNLCTEITLNTSKEETAVCNLGSLNLARMIQDGRLDEKKVKETVTVGIRMLDNVIDLNFYPTPEAKHSNLTHRPIGMGLMGYHDALHQMDIPFDSEENIAFADRSMEMISHCAILASSELAKERGPYPSYKGSKWDRGILPIDTLDILEKERRQPLKIDRQSSMDWGPVREHIRKHGMRNSNTLAIAPTATIANITGVTPCVEPLFKNIYMKENLSGNFCVVNRYLVTNLEKRGLWDPQILNQIKHHDGSVTHISTIPLDLRRKFKEVFEIDPMWIIRAAAKRAKWIDQSASTNLFLTTKSGEAISNLYITAWEMGLKTTYYLRTLAASQVSKVTTLEMSAPLMNGNGNGKASSDISILKPPVDSALEICSAIDPECEACQ